MTEAKKFDKGKPKARYLPATIFERLLDNFADDYIHILKGFPAQLELIQKTGEIEEVDKAIRLLLIGAERRNNLKAVLFDVAKVMEFGATKYGHFNYQNGCEYSRIIDAIYRHFIKYLSMEFEYGQHYLRVDEESKVNHMAHVIANLSMLSYFMTNKTGLNDLKSTSIYEVPNLNPKES